MTPREFANAGKGYHQKVQREFRTGWEQARWIGSQVINKPVFGYKIAPKAPIKLLPFDWDNEAEERDFTEEIEKIKEHRKWLQEQ